LALALLDADAHRLQRACQVADLVTGGARHRRLVVAAAEAARRLRQRAQRLADAPRRQHAADREHGHAQHRECQQRQL